MKKKEIDEYIKSKSVTQSQYVAPTVQTHVDNRAPAMVQVAQTVKPTVKSQPTNDVRTVKQPTLNESIKNYGETLKNSAVKNQGFNLSNAITDIANLSDATKNVLKSIPGIGNYYKGKDNARKTAINLATNMGTGAVGTLEKASDAASDLIFNPLEQRYNYAFDYLTKGKKTADENLKDLKQMQERDIKRNRTEEFTRGYNDIADELEKGSAVKRDNILGQIAQGTGGMVPALVLGQAFGGTPELTNISNLQGKEKLAAALGNVGKTYMAQLPSNAVLGASSYGGGMEEALNDGASMNRARAYGLTNAGIEQLTEMLTGGVPGLEGKGGIDQFVEPLINRNTNGYLNALLRAGYGALGEGLEETTGTYLDALAKRGILGKNIDWNEVNKEALQSGLAGAATGAILNAPSTTQDFQNVRAENQARNVLGNAEYAEGRGQYNPDYKGWENQREENRIENEKKAEERKQRNEEFNRIQQEREEEARKTQELAQEREKEQERLRQQEETKRAQEAIKQPQIVAQTDGRKTQDIKEFKDVRNDYNQYYKKADMEIFDNTILKKAMDTIEGSKRYGRTKQQWLDVANNIGMQLRGQDIDTIKKYAFESFKDQAPNRNFNKQGKGTDMWGAHDWVRAVYEGARVNDTQQATQIQSSPEAVQSNVETEQQAPQVDNKVEQQIERFKERGGRVEDTVPEGFIKTENATTAPKGYTWYNNGKSRFGGEYENVLVKDSTQNDQQIEDLKQEIKQEERLVEQGKSDDGYHLAELQKEYEELLKQNIQQSNVAEEIKEPVIKAEEKPKKVETKEEEKQHLIDSGMPEDKAQILYEMPKPPKETLSERIKNNKASLREEISYWKRNLVDKGETIYKIGKKTKNPNLYAKYDKRGTTTGEANYDIGVAQTDLKGKPYKNFTDANGKKTSMSLNQIWDGMDLKAANEYLAHYLNVDRYPQLNEDGSHKYVIGPSVTDEMSKQRISELEAEHPELKRFGENIWQYEKNQLQSRVEAGQISQAQANQFLKETPHYVHLQREIPKGSTTTIEFDKNGNAKVNKNIKEFKGSTLNILPFQDTMAQYTLEIRNSIRDNIFAQELAKTLGVGTNGETVKNIEDIFGTNPELLRDNGDGTYSLTFFNKGTATVIPIDQGIYESLQPNKHYDFEDRKFFKGVRKIDNLRKALLTDKNPMFLATNMMKDAFDAPLNSKYPAKLPISYAKAFKEIILQRGKGANYQQYQALGGLQNTYFDSEGYKKQGSKLNPLTWIEKANNAIEQLPRLAEFISTMEATGDVDQAMYNAAEVTTNFKRGGDVAKAANRNGATFLNASIQGFDKQIRNFTDIQTPKQAVQMLGKVLVLGIAPGLLNDLMWDDDDEYKEMQDYQKDRYYLFKGKNGEWIRIPKGRAVSVFQSAARRTGYALKGQEDAFKDFGKFASGQIAPNNPFENNIISPIVDVARNESWSGNAIIPQSLEKKKAEKQYNEKTDKASRKISETINKSKIAKTLIPKNFRSAMGINYLVDQYSGAIGDITLPMITPKVSSKNTNVLTKPVTDKFTTDAVYSNKNVNSFYDTMNKLAEEDETPVDIAKNNYMTSKSIALSKLYKEQRNIQNDESLSKSEKYEQAREVQKQINAFTKQAVKDVKNIKEEEYYLKIGDDYYKKVVEDGEEKYKKDSSKKIPVGDKYALYDYFREKYEKSKE